MFYIFFYLTKTEELNLQSFEVLKYEYAKSPHAEAVGVPRLLQSPCGRKWTLAVKK